MTREEILAYNPFGVLVQLSAKEAVVSQIQVGSGSFELVIDAMGEDGGMWTSVRAKVLKVGNDYGYHYLQEGDTAYINYRTIKDYFGHYNEGQSKKIYVSDDTEEVFLFINEAEVVTMVNRNGQIISPPNRVILSRAQQDTDSVLGKIERDKDFDNIYKVEAVGEIDLDHCTDYNSFAVPEVGQVVCIGANGGITVEFDMIKDLQTEYLWCRLSEIMAYEKV